MGIDSIDSIDLILLQSIIRQPLPGTRSLIALCREMQVRPKFLFASSIAAFGGGAHASDDSKLLPEVGVMLEFKGHDVLVGQLTII